MQQSLKIFALVLFFSATLHLDPALSAAGGVAPGFDATYWIARLHIFLISFVLMTGGSIAYYFLLRRKKAQ